MKNVPRALYRTSRRLPSVGPYTDARANSKPLRAGFVSLFFKLSNCGEVYRHRWTFSSRFTSCRVRMSGTDRILFSGVRWSSWSCLPWRQPFRFFMHSWSEAITRRIFLPHLSHSSLPKAAVSRARMCSAGRVFRAVVILGFRVLRAHMCWLYLSCFYAPFVRSLTYCFFSFIALFSIS